MDLNCSKGTKVVFKGTRPLCGCGISVMNEDILNAMTSLEVGRLYTVNRIVSKDSKILVELAEMPGMMFNTLDFTDQGE